MLLIDSDFLAYKAAQACEIGIDFGEDVIIAQSQFSEVLKVFHNELNKVTKDIQEAEDFLKTLKALFFLYFQIFGPAFSSSDSRGTKYFQKVWFPPPLFLKIL